MSEVKRISDLPELTAEEIQDTDIILVRVGTTDYYITFLDLKTAVLA